MDEDLRARYRINRPYHKENDRTRPIHRPAAPKASHQPVAAAARVIETPALAPLRQPYTRPAVLIDHLPEPAAPTAVKTKKRSKKSILIPAIVLICLVLAAAGAFWYFHKKPTGPVPASVMSSVNFPILYPTKLPPGFWISPQSYHIGDGVLVYTARTAGSDSIAFSVESRPTNFDFNSFYKNLLGNAVPFINSVGQAAIGKQSGNRNAGSMVTDRSWLLVTAPATVLSADSLRTILNNIEIIPNK